MSRMKMLKTVFFCVVAFLLFANIAVCSTFPSGYEFPNIPPPKNKVEKPDSWDPDNKRPESEKYECPSSSQGSSVPCYKHVPLRQYSDLTEKEKKSFGKLLVKFEIDDLKKEKFDTLRKYMLTDYKAMSLNWPPEEFNLSTIQTNYEVTLSLYKMFGYDYIIGDPAKIEDAEYASYVAYLFKLFDIYKDGSVENENLFVGPDKMNCKLMNNIGIYPLINRKYSESESLLNAAIESCKGDFEAYRMRGIARYKLGKFEEAVSDFNESDRLIENMKAMLREKVPLDEISTSFTGAIMDNISYKDNKDIDYLVYTNFLFKLKSMHGYLDYQNVLETVDNAEDQIENMNSYSKVFRRENDRIRGVLFLDTGMFDEAEDYISCKEKTEASDIEKAVLCAKVYNSKGDYSKATKIVEKLISENVVGYVLENNTIYSYGDSGFPCGVKEPNMNESKYCTLKEFYMLTQVAENIISIEALNEIRLNLEESDTGKPDIETFKQAASELYDNEKYDDASIKYLAVAILEPGDAVNEYNLASSLRLAGKNVEAVYHYKRYLYFAGENAEDRDDVLQTIASLTN